MKKMLKRADGSYSQRGLWDNIRANKGSGKKPTKEMLEQEAKIKSKKQTGGSKTVEPTFPAADSRFMNAPSKPKQVTTTPATALPKVPKETRKERKEREEKESMKYRVQYAPARFKQTGGPGKPEKATSDSTAYYKNKEQSFRQLAKSEKGDTKVSKFNKDFFEGEANKAVSNQLRQYHKGKPGFDKNGNPSRSQVKSIKPNWLEESKELMFGGITDRYGNSSTSSRKTGGKKKYQTAGPKFTVTGNLGALQGGNGCVSGSCKEVMASEGTSYANAGQGTNYTGPGGAKFSMKPRYQDRVVKKSKEQIAADQAKYQAAQDAMKTKYAEKQARREANAAAYKASKTFNGATGVYANPRDLSPVRIPTSIEKTGGKRKSNKRK